MSELCEWLHSQLEELPLIKYPFELEILPEGGIYFFYEKRELWGHDGSGQRIVRISTHKKNNFISRAGEHYLFDSFKMEFDATKPPPHDRSIFRKHLGGAILNMLGDPYLKVWDMRFIDLCAREQYAQIRDITKEKRIETKVTEILRNNFSFRFIVFDNEVERIESSLIGTVAGCKKCKPSENWLGNFSPIYRIKSSGMWQVQFLKSKPINDKDKDTILSAINRTKEFLNEKPRHSPG